MRNVDGTIVGGGGGGGNGAIFGGGGNGDNKWFGGGPGGGNGFSGCDASAFAFGGERSRHGATDGFIAGSVHLLLGASVGTLFARSICTRAQSSSADDASMSSGVVGAICIIFGSGRGSGHGNVALRNTDFERASGFTSNFYSGNADFEISSGRGNAYSGFFKRLSNSANSRSRSDESEAMAKAIRKKL